MNQSIDIAEISAISEKYARQKFLHDISPRLMKGYLSDPIAGIMAILCKRWRNRVPLPKLVALGSPRDILVRLFESSIQCP